MIETPVSSMGSTIVADNNRNLLSKKCIYCSLSFATAYMEKKWIKK